jgi:hypothetical protein
MNTLNGRIKVNYIIGAGVAFFGFVLLRLGGGADYGNALAFGLFAGIVYTQKNPLYFAAGYMMSAFIFGWEYLLFAVVQCAVMTSAVLIHEKLNKKLSPALGAAYMACSLVYFFVAGAGELEAFFAVASAGVLAILFAGATAMALRALINKGLRYTLGADEV